MEESELQLGLVGSRESTPTGALRGSNPSGSGAVGRRRRICTCGERRHHDDGDRYDASMVGLLPDPNGDVAARTTRPGPDSVFGHPKTIRVLPARSRPCASSVQLPFKERAAPGCVADSLFQLLVQRGSLPGVSIEGSRAGTKSP